MAILIFLTSNQILNHLSNFTEFQYLNLCILFTCLPISQLFVYSFIDCFLQSVSYLFTILLTFSCLFTFLSAVCLQSVSKTVWDASVARPRVIWGALLTGSHISHSRLVPKIANLRVRAKFGLPLQKKKIRG